MNRIVITVIFLIIIISTQALSQTYYLNIQAGVGYARYITDMDQSGLNQNGIVSSFRVMWEPEHLLRIGLESGYNSLYTFEENGIETDFGTTDAKSSLSSIPVFFVIAMNITPSINIMGGVGPSFLKTSFDAFGWHTKSTQISTSYYVAAAYNYSLNKKFSLGCELKWYRIQKIEDGTLSLQLTVGYRILSW
jgi:hypothetical protein